MNELLTAIYSRWNLDQKLSLVEAEQGQAKPYCLMVPISSDPEYTFDSASDSTLMQFSVFSERKTVTECVGIANNIYALFDDADLNVPGQQTVRCERGQSRIIRDDNIWHYIIEYEILLHR